MLSHKLLNGTCGVALLDHLAIVNVATAELCVLASAIVVACLARTSERVYSIVVVAPVKSPTLAGLCKALLQRRMLAGACALIASGVLNFPALPFSCLLLSALRRQERIRRIASWLSGHKQGEGRDDSAYERYLVALVAKV